MLRRWVADLKQRPTDPVQHLGLKPESNLRDRKNHRSTHARTGTSSREYYRNSGMANKGARQTAPVASCKSFYPHSIYYLTGRRGVARIRSQRAHEYSSRIPLRRITSSFSFLS